LRYNKDMRKDLPVRTVPPAVTFWGAAQSVTGSMHLIEFDRCRVLLDCGLVRAHPPESRLRNRHFPFAPATIDAVVLSHAHVDHCGNLPNLVRQGFGGPIFCTPATRDLIAVMLDDSARIQEDLAQVEQVVGAAPNDRGPLYTKYDVQQTLRQCITVPYEQPQRVLPNVRLRFLDAGHILGSAVVALTIGLGMHEYRISFTGDLGRRGLPFLREPTPVPAADLIISESTYGGRTHDSVENMAARMGEIVRRTVARGGKVLVPAFSLGRTQVVVHYLRRWMADGILPRLPLYLDSPLAVRIAEVYRRYPEHLREEESGPPVQIVATPEETQDLLTRPEPYLVVASGGMCDGGRIMPYLRQFLDDPRTSLVLVSYQAPHTLGAQLLERKPTVRFHGRRWNKWADVIELNGFSGHADRNDFLALLGPAAAETGRVRLVHGEVVQAEALALSLREQGFRDVAVPAWQESVAVA
jgi:metallo-beta-lactamase family protein